MRNQNPDRTTEKTQPANMIEGEGSYTGTRDYNARTAEFLDNNDAEKLGRDAADALDGEEGDELRAAEQTAKNGMQANQRSGQKGTQNGNKQGGDNGQHEKQRKQSERDKQSIERSEGEGMIGAKNDKTPRH